MATMETMSQRWLQEATLRLAREGHPQRTMMIVESWRVVPGRRRTRAEVEAVAAREYGPARNAHATENR